MPGQLSQLRRRKVRDFCCLYHYRYLSCNSDIFSQRCDRNNCGWIFHNLVHVANDQTTSSFEFSTLSLEPRESIVSIAANAGDSTIFTKECRLPISLCIGHRPPSFHDKKERKVRDLCCPYNYRWLSCHSWRPLCGTRSHENGKKTLDESMLLTRLRDQRKTQRNSPPRNALKHLCARWFERSPPTRD